MVARERSEWSDCIRVYFFFLFIILKNKNRHGNEYIIKCAQIASANFWFPKPNLRVLVKIIVRDTQKKSNQWKLIIAEDKI